MKRSPAEFLACGYVILLAIQPYIVVEARSWRTIEIPAIDAIHYDDPLYAPTSVLLMEDNSFMYGGWFELNEDNIDSSSKNFNNLTIGPTPQNRSNTVGHQPSYQTVADAPTNFPSKVPSRVPTKALSLSPSVTVHERIEEDEQATEQYDAAISTCPPNHTLFLLWLYDFVGEGWGSTKLAINETFATSSSEDVIFVGSLDASNRVVTYEAGNRHRGLDVTRRESSAQGFAATFSNGLTSNEKSIIDKGDENERIIKNQTSSSNPHYLCLKPDACYSAQVSGDAFSEEISWEVTRVKLLGTEVSIGSVVATSVGVVCTFSVEGSCETTCNSELLYQLIFALTQFVKDTESYRAWCTGTAQSMEPTAGPTTQLPTVAPTSEVLRKKPSTPDYVFNYNNTASSGVSEYMRMRDVIVSASPSSKMAIDDKNSTQSRALHWLFVSDSSGLSDLRLVQRWALASFYYATNGDSWVVNQGWLQHNDECDWFGVHCDQKWAHR